MTVLVITPVYIALIKGGLKFDLHFAIKCPVPLETLHW